jgi:hypothetical protein
VVGYKLQRGPEVNRNYKQDLHIYKKDSKKIERNAIESRSFSTVIELSAQHHGQQPCHQGQITWGKGADEHLS